MEIQEDSQASGVGRYENRLGRRASTPLACTLVTTFVLSAFAAFAACRYTSIRQWNMESLSHFMNAAGVPSTDARRIPAVHAVPKHAKLAAPFPEMAAVASARGHRAIVMSSTVASAQAASTDTERQAEQKAIKAMIAQRVSEKLAKAGQATDIPDKYAGILRSLFISYMTEVAMAGKDLDYYEDVVTRLSKKVMESLKSPYKFEPYHEAIREPYDYYALGNQFIGGLVNDETSALVGTNKIADMQKQIEAGDNVVLFANHQSEADPQIFSVLLDKVAPSFAESIIFVAGDRVTTDLIAQPFSKGRNLLCIFSKKHIDNPPELKGEKSQHNRLVMKKMQELFIGGGKVIWVAPSGGRDRKDSSGRYTVSPFDSKSIEMFRLMSDKASKKAGRKTHFYPLSMLTYGNAPPPDAVGGDLGEQRTVKFSPAGLYFGDEVDLEDFAEGCVVDQYPRDCDSSRSREELRDALSNHIHDIVADHYRILEDSLEGKMPGQGELQAVA